jgi:hypothetical protein
MPSPRSALEFRDVEIDALGNQVMELRGDRRRDTRRMGGALRLAVAAVALCLGGPRNFGFSVRQSTALSAN